MSVGHFGLKMCHESIPHVLLAVPYLFCLTLKLQLQRQQETPFMLRNCAAEKELAHLSRTPRVIFITYSAWKLLEGITIVKIA